MNLEEYKKNIRDELNFCELISDIGVRNKEDLAWWASAISSKNMGISDLWNNIASYISGQKILSRKASIFALFLVLIKQIIRIYVLANPLFRLKYWMSSEKEYKLLLFSYMNSNYWKKAGEKHEDPYFKNLLDRYDRDSKKYIIVTHTFGNIFDSGKYIPKSYYGERKIVPIELFMGTTEVLKAFILTLKCDLKLSKPANFKGVDISPLLLNEFKEEKFNGEIFSNLCIYLAMKNILLTIKPQKILWPWENHSWEKLLLIAKNKYCSSAITAGYQSSTIMLFLLNFFSGKKELEYAPYPDRIITNGKTTFQILKSFGSYPENCLVEGCAWRYDYLLGIEKWQGTLDERNIIGIAMTGFNKTNVKILNIISKITDVDFIIKYHPMLPEEKFLNSLDEKPPSNIKTFNGSISEILKKVSILIYSETAVCMEAAMMGIPCIYIDTGKGISGDSMFNTQDLKWTAGNPEELEKCIKEIKVLSLTELNERRKNAERYIRDYFHAVTEDKIKLFTA